MISHLPFRGLIKKEVGKMMEKMYGPDGEMPMDQKGKEFFSARVGTRVLSFLLKCSSGLRRR